MDDEAVCHLRKTSGWVRQFLSFRGKIVWACGREIHINNNSNNSWLDRQDQCKQSKVALKKENCDVASKVNDSANQDWLAQSRDGTSSKKGISKQTK